MGSIPITCSLKRAVAIDVVTVFLILALTSVNSGLNLVIKKSAVDLAESHTCAVLHKGQNKAHRQSH